MKKTGLFPALLKAFGFILLFLVCQVVTSIVCEGLFAAVLLEKGLSASEFTNALYAAQNRNIYEMMIFSYLLFFGIIFLKYKTKLPEKIGAKKTSPLSLVNSALMGFGAFPVVLFLFTFLSSIPAVSQSQSQYNEQMEAISSAGGSLVFEILAVCILGPIMEELLFRGLVQNTLKKAMRPAFAIFLAALSFGLVHGNLYQLIFTLPLGIFMGYMAHRFSSLWPSVLIHIAFNSSNYFLRIGEFLGYGEEDDITLFFTLAVMLFYGFSLLLSVILYQNFFRKRKALPFGFPKTKEDLKNILFKEANEGETMAAPEFMIVGLGNPGAKYEKNRHNAGFMALDFMAEKENIPLKNLRFKALTGEGFMGGKKVLLVKPQTFMNLSGEAVREAAAFYKIPPEKILILFDDINFAPGVFRIREKGSAGGHNGIKSIISHLGTEEFPRVKMGVGKVPEGWNLMHHVLANLPPEELKKVENSFEDIHSTARFFVEGNLNRAGALFNGKEH